MSAPSLPELIVSDWQPVWSLNLAAGAAVTLYAGAAMRTSRPWPRRRTLLFLAGVGCLLVATESGLDTLDDQLLSVHMVQHMLLLLVAPGLLLGGRPLLLALRTLHGPARRALARNLSRVRPVTRPWVCLAGFGAVVLGTHLPSFYDATLSHPVLHDGEHVAYVFAGLLLWWPLLEVDPASTRRPDGLGKLVYIIAAMVPMALVGAYLNRAPNLVYPAYGPPARALGVSVLGDQAQAGAIMWVLGDLIMVAVGLWTAVAAMVAEEHRQRRRDRHRPGPTVGEALR